MYRTMNLKGFVLILGIILLVFLVLHLVLRGNADSRTEKEKELLVRYSRLEEENKELKAELNMVDTDEYIMTSAVRDYSFVKRNAIRFEYTNPEALYAYSEEELQILMDEMND